MSETNHKSGILALIGGAEDKQDDMVVLRKVLEKTQPKSVVIIPTASYYTREVGESYKEAFRKLGVNDVETFDIRYDDEADREEHHEKLAKANLVYFGGGDQTKLVKTIIHSRLFRTIRERFFEGTLHIAGTSAGAAAASDPMTYDGDYQGFSKGAVANMQGLGFIDDITVDTHFLARERIPRLVQFLISGKCTKGIGIDEDTGVIIYPDYKMEVIGSGMVTIINTDKITGSNYHDLENKDIYSVNNIRIGFLAPGTTFSLKRWAILKTTAEKNNRELFDRLFLNF
jgi:cyanophycinase